jgi:TonB-linked SusC/RagA family outer membrane protein
MSRRHAWYASEHPVRPSAASHRLQGFRACLVAAAALSIIPWSGGLQAQQELAGRVLDEGGRILAGAQIMIVGTQLAVLTNARGEFRLQNVPGPEATLRVVMIGYRDHTETVTPGRTDLEIILQVRAVALDELVVTGTAGEQRVRSIGNVVGRVNASEIQAISPRQNVQDMLSTEVPGVRIISTGGEVGTGGVSRIRGVSSLALGATPLIYVDGVRVNSQDFSAALGVGFRGNQQPSRMNDFSPEDIESIEVIKGPAAATLYGTEASNGVIQIITKKGRAESPQVNFTMKQGANWYPDVYNVFPSVYYRCTGVDQSNVDPLLRCNAGEVTEANILRLDRDVYGNEWFRTGHNQGYQAEVSGSSGPISYFVSGGLEKEEGTVPYNWLDRLTSRANLDYTPSDLVRFSFNLGITRSEAQSASAQQPLSTAIIWGCPAPGCEAGSGLPNALDGPFRGYIAYLPEAYQNEIEGFQNVDRATLGFTTHHNPTSWLNHRLTIGGDFSNIRNSDLYRATGNLGNFQNQGRKRVVNLRTTFGSLDYGANATLDLTPDIRTTTSFGVQYYRRAEESTFAQGEQFAVEALETITSGANRTATEDFLENKTLGVYIQEQVAWRDRLYLTGAIRGDDNSAFGQNFEFVVYPKLSASWVISEEPFWEPLAFIRDMRLRAAWGRAGQQPDVFDALRTYNPTVGSDGPALTPENIGNPDLKPEVGDEVELGFDASFLEDRVGFEFTWFRQQTRDAIVRVPTVPSVGFPGVQFQNIGEVHNRGLEMALTAQPYRGRSVGVDVAFTLSRNQNEVMDLGGQPPIVQSATFGQWHVEGFPLAGIFNRRVVSADIGQDAGGRNTAINVMCEGGERVTGTNFSRGGGAPVPCSEAPEVYWGQPVPEWEGSFALTLSVGQSVQLFGLLDFIQGRSFVNGDVAANHFFFLNSRAILERTDPILLAYESLGAAGIWPSGTHSGDFGKIRTVSASYTFPNQVADFFRASRVSLTTSMDNVATLWMVRENFGQPVMDVERSYQTGTPPGLLAFHQEGWPSTRRFTSTLRISF